MRALGAEQRSNEQRFPTQALPSSHRSPQVGPPLGCPSPGVVPRCTPVTPAVPGVGCSGSEQGSIAGTAPEGLHADTAAQQDPSSRQQPHSHHPELHSQHPAKLWEPRLIPCSSTPRGSIARARSTAGRAKDPFLSRGVKAAKVRAPRSGSLQS